MEISKDPKTGLMYRPTTFDLAVIKEQTCYRPIMNHPMKVLDIGGNIGAFAHFAFESGAQYVRSYEPEPYNFQMLQINSRPEDHSIINAAVVNNACEDETLSLSVNVGINKGLHSLVPRRGRTSVKVDTVKLDEAFENAAFDVVKIDIEGYEYYLLDGFTFPDSVKWLAIEYHFDRKVYERMLSSTLHNNLASQGFYAINNGNLNKKNFATLMLYRR